MRRKKVLSDVAFNRDMDDIAGSVMSRLLAEDGAPPTAVQTVIGLDLSLRATGVAVVSGHPRHKMNDGFNADSASIRAGEDVRGPERLAVLTSAITSWVASRGGGKAGDIYVMEGYGFGSQMAHSLGELGGCVRLAIWEGGGNLIVIPPTTLKKYITGSGAAEKSIVMKYLFKRWAFDVDDDNQCDAFGCAVLGLVDAGPRDQWTNIETEILTNKVERYAGKGQASWASRAPVRTVAKRTRKRRS